MRSSFSESGRDVLSRRHMLLNIPVLPWHARRAGNSSVFRFPVCRNGSLRSFSLFALLLFLMMTIACSAERSDTPGPEETTLVHAGEPAPDFSVQTLDGNLFSLSGARGNVVLISFFATWCPPCRKELPHLEKEVWQEFRDQEFRLVAIGREESPEKLRPFVEKMGLNFPVAADPEREVYSEYAQAYIPRLFLVGRDGIILYESSDFDEVEFENMKRKLEIALQENGETDSRPAPEEKP